VGGECTKREVVDWGDCSVPDRIRVVMSRL